jgi:homoserine O-acetyltransferase
MAGRYAEGGAEGSWNGLVGPGKAIDTDRLFVVSSNMLGSSYGSTSPAHLNPKTGQNYGPDFPEITLVDIVNAQKALLDSIGVKHLAAVAGPSFGGYQTFQWGVSYPDFMDGLVPVVSSPKGIGRRVGGEGADRHPGQGPALERRLVLREWRHHRSAHRDAGGDTQALWHRRPAQPAIPRQGPARRRDRQARACLGQGLRRQFAGRARRASVRFNAEKDFAKTKARVLYVLSRTDKVFPPSIAPDVTATMKAAGINAQYFEIDSEFGHSASGLDAAKWAPTLKAFMASLDKRS